MTTEHPPPSISTASPAISLRNLSRRFGRLNAVDNMSLDIPAGSTTALIGLNGAGKSTAIRLMVGLLPPSAGSISVLGHDVQRHPITVRRMVGYVPDRSTIYPWMTVAQVLEFCQSLRLCLNGWDGAYAADLLKLFRLDPTQRVKRLSKGQAAKLSLLVAIAPRPPVLILDEPTDGMDPLARDEFLDGVLRAIVEREQTVLLSSHALTDVQRLADRVAIMHEGRILHDGPMEDFIASTKRVRATLRDQPAPLVAPPGTIWQRADKREWIMTVRGFCPDTLVRLQASNTIDALEVSDIGLDDIFKDLIRGQPLRQETFA